MKIIFFGTSKFAADILGLIYAKCLIMAVITQPDKKSGRNLKLLPSPAKVKAEKLGIPVLQPADVNNPAFVAALKNMAPDAFLVVSYGSILGNSLLAVPKLCALNIHPSLLPKYRGAAPIHRALLSGETRTGVTIIRMNERLDAGDIILRKELEIDGTDNAVSLSDRLLPIGVELFIKALGLLEAGKASFEQQDDAAATFAPKLKKEEGVIDWSVEGVFILNKIKAFFPWPGAYTYLAGRVLKIIKAEEQKAENYGAAIPGEIVLADQKKGLIVKTKDSAISILELQIEGKKPMPVELFLRGHNVKAGTMLGK